MEFWFMTPYINPGV